MKDTKNTLKNPRTVSVAELLAKNRPNNSNKIIGRRQRRRSINDSNSIKVTDLTKGIFSTPEKFNSRICNKTYIPPGYSNYTYSLINEPSKGTINKSLIKFTRNSLKKLSHINYYLFNSKSMSNSENTLTKNINNLNENLKKLFFYTQTISIIVRILITLVFSSSLFIVFNQLWKWNTICALTLGMIFILGFTGSLGVLYKKNNNIIILVSIAVSALITFGPLAMLQII